MKKISYFLLISILALGLTACQHSQGGSSGNKNDAPKTVKKTRDNGTLSSITQVDGDDFAHGIRVNYYEDGKTVRSKTTFVHGSKEGPAILYYKNGQIFEHCGFHDGKKHGLSKKYHKNGKMAASCEFNKGEALPGLVEYRDDGTKVTDYPKITFREIDRLAFENTMILEVNTHVRSKHVKVYEITSLDEKTTFKDLKEIKNGKASLPYTVRRGDVLMKSIVLYVETPTEMGNTLVRKLEYRLAARNG